MNLHFTDASSLAIIDSQLAERHLTPAEHEIIRQIIYKTGDFGYASLVQFTKDVLIEGASALNDKTSIVVDVPEIQVSIVPQLQKTFGNLVYCCQTTATQAQQGKTKSAWGLEILAKTHKNSVYIIGQERTALTILAELSQKKAIQPALIILTAPIFKEQKLKQWLKNSAIPSIYIKNNKGNAIVASAIFNTLINLGWRVASLDANSIKK